MRNNIRRIFCLIMAMTMLFSLSMPAFADGEEDELVCTCEAAEGEAHAAGCPLYTEPEGQPPVCTTLADCPADTHEADCLSLCSGLADCAAQVHQEGCESQKTPEPTCSGLADCVVEPHSENCLSLCAKLADCTAQSHQEGCLSQQQEQPSVSCTKAANCPADTHEADCEKAIAEAEAAKAAADAEAAKQAAIKAVQDMIDALPDVPVGYDPVNPPADIAAQLQAITEAYQALSEDSQTQINADRLLAFYAPGPAAVAKIDRVEFDSLQAAIDACGVGDNTITLLSAISDDVIINQTEGKNITIDGATSDGAKYSFSGTIYIKGHARNTGKETLTIQNINFTTNESSHDFISANETSSEGRYAHNVTITNCSFNSTAEGNTVAEVMAMRFRQAYNITVSGCSANNLYGVMWTTGGDNISVSDLKAEDCKNGLSFGTSDGVVIKNSSISVSADGYGIRADGSGAYSLTVDKSKVDAYFPVLIRNNTASGYELTVSGDTALTATNDSGINIAFSNGDADTVDKLTVPTGSFTLTNNAANTIVYPADIIPSLDSSSGAYVISTLKQLEYFRDMVNEGDEAWLKANVELGADIDMSSVENWVPIGLNADDSSTRFSGVFDGKGHILSNLTINQAAAYQAAGLFGATCGQLENFTIKNASITAISSGEATDNGIAVVAGSLYNEGTTYTGSITNVHVDGATLSGNRYMGGIAGYVYGTITDCTVKDISITCTPNSTGSGFDNGDKCGGIAGYLGSGDVSENSATDITILGYRDIGGIVGCNNGTVASNTVSGDISLTADQTTNYYGDKDFNVATVTGRGSSDNSNTDTAATVSITMKPQVAKIGNNYYRSLEDAVANAKDNDTIVLLEDVTITAPLNIDKSITIEGAKKSDDSYPTITYTGKDRAITVEDTASGKNLTVKNLTIKAEKAQRGINYNTTGSLTLDNVTITASNYAVNLPGSADGAKVTIKDSTLNGLNTLNLWGENMTVTVTGSIINTYDNSDAEGYAPIAINNDGTTVATGTAVTLSGGSINYYVNGKLVTDQIAVLCAAGSVTNSDTAPCSINGLIVDPVAISPSGYINTLQDAVDYAAKKGKVPTLLRNVEISKPVKVSSNATIDAANFTISKTSTVTNAFSIPGEVTLTIQNWNGTKTELEALVPGYIVPSESDNSYTITGKSGFMLGSTSYGTLEEAVAAANNGSGGTITMLSDYETANIIELTKSVTIDGNGYTLTYTGNDRAITVESGANGADLTVENLVIAADNAERGINYNTNGSLTLDNVAVTARSYAVNLPGSSDGATVAITDSDLTALIALNIWGSNVEATVTNSDLTTNDNSTAEDYAVIQLNNNGTEIADGTAVTVTGGSLTYNDPNGGHDGPAVSNWTSTGKVNVSDSTRINGVRNGDILAAIGYAGYTNLADAISAAQGTDKAVRLTKDVTVASSITVSKNVSIDADGHKISYTGTGSLFKLSKGAVVTISDMENAVSIAAMRAMVPGYCVTKGGYVIQEHSYIYTAKGNVITETCNNGKDGKSCGHKATATLEEIKPNSTYTYTGKKITPLTVSYSVGNNKDIDSWAGPTNLTSKISYTGNTAPGTAKGSVSITGSNNKSATAVKSFSIQSAELGCWEFSDYYRDSGNSLSFTIETNGKYVHHIVSAKIISGNKVTTLSYNDFTATPKDDDLVLTINSSAMAKLGVGRYTLEVEMSADKSNTVHYTTSEEFRVRYPRIIPFTGDTANFLLWGGLLLGATAAMGCTVVILKKSGKKH